jgi:hypothetical protein
MRSSNGVIVGYVLFVASCVSQTKSDNARVRVTDAGTGGVSTGGVQGNATGGVGVGSGGSNGGASGSGGSPSLTGGQLGCGGAVAITCETQFGGPMARRPAFRATVGTFTRPEAWLARVCRNGICATIDVGEGIPAPQLLFGPDDHERIAIAIENDLGARVLSVVWMLSPTDPTLKDGDVYSLRLLDAAGKTVRLDRKSATYTRLTKYLPASCQSSDPPTPFPCVDVAMTDLPKSDAGPPDASGEAGSSADGSTPPRCCPRDQNPPPGDVNDPNNPFCFALGGPDLGGCYKTCGWTPASPGSSICDAPARSEITRGCEAWVADVPDAATALGLCK